MQAHRLVVDLAAAPPSFPVPPLGAGHRRRRLGRDRLLENDRACGRPHIGPAAADRIEQRPAAVLQQVPSVAHLSGLGSASARRIGVGAAAIAADHLGAGVFAQPRDERLGAAVRQEVDDAAPLEVAKDGAVAPAAAPRPVVHLEHARCLLRRPRRPAPKHAQQGGGADRHRQADRQARSRLAAQG